MSPDNGHGVALHAATVYGLTIQDRGPGTPISLVNMSRATNQVTFAGCSNQIIKLALSVESDRIHQHKKVWPSRAYRTLRT